MYNLHHELFFFFHFVSIRFFLFLVLKVPCVDNLLIKTRGGEEDVVWFVLVTVRYNFMHRSLSCYPWTRSWMFFVLYFFCFLFLFYCFYTPPSSASTPIPSSTNFFNAGGNFDSKSFIPRDNVGVSHETCNFGS